MDIPKCRICREYMEEIGDLGGTVQIVGLNGEVIGERPRRLHQCSNCKGVAID